MSTAVRTPASKVKKGSLITGIGQLVLDLLHKPRKPPPVVIEDVETESWG
jgi:4-oxalocrotonate tautomerase